MAEEGRRVREGRGWGREGRRGGAGTATEKRKGATEEKDRRQ